MRLIDETGENLGVVDIKKALEMSLEQGVDLVEVASNINPPVARLIDLGKYLYQQEKHAKKQKSNSKVEGLKAVKIGLSISEHDALVKIKKLEEFLKDGNKVKIEMFLKGRARANMTFAGERFKNFISMIKVPFKEDQPVKRLPSGFMLIIRNE